MDAFSDLTKKFSELAKQKLDSSTEGEILFQWKYDPPKYKKVLGFLLPILAILAYFGISFLLGRGRKFFPPFYVIAIFFFLLQFAMKGAKAYEYALTKKGVYRLSSDKKRWEKLGYWEEFIDHVRSSTYIQLRKKGPFGNVSLHFNENSQEVYTILTIINENVFRYPR